MVNLQNTSEVAKTITESGLEMADRLVHTQYDFLWSRRLPASIPGGLRYEQR